MEIIEMGGDSPVVARVSYDVYSPEYKRGMVLEWAKSGLSQKGFSRGKGIPDTTFAGWAKRWSIAKNAERVANPPRPKPGKRPRKGDYVQLTLKLSF